MTEKMSLRKRYSEVCTDKLPMSVNLALFSLVKQHERLTDYLEDKGYIDVLHGYRTLFRGAGHFTSFRHRLNRLTAILHKKEIENFLDPELSRIKAGLRNDWDSIPKMEEPKYSMVVSCTQSLSREEHAIIVAALESVRQNPKQLNEMVRCIHTVMGIGLNVQAGNMTSVDDGERLATILEG